MPGFSEQGVNLGYGSAISMITSVIMMAIALIYQKLSNKMRSIY
jgi:ABC-type sugar transport system permease subunit